MPTFVIRHFPTAGALLVLACSHSLAVAQTGLEVGGSTGVCTVSTGVMSGQKYAASKCYLDTDPGNYKISHRVWERDNQSEYRELAKASGRRFRCNFATSGMSHSGTDILTYYKITNCKPTSGSSRTRTSKTVNQPSRSELRSSDTQPEPGTSSTQNDNARVCYSCEETSGTYKTFCIREGTPLKSVTSWPYTCRKL